MGACVRRLGLVVAAVFPLAAAGSEQGKVLRVADRPEMDDVVAQWITRHLDDLRDLYCTIHANPELSLEERESARRLAERMRSAGFEVTTGVGGTGVVAVLRNGEGPTVLVRCDMDALPVREQTGLPYASRAVVTRPDGTKVPVMHACGHDMHQAVWVGVGELLAEFRDRWRGTVVMIAQPAEELGMGARAMIEDGLFERFPRPDACVALHVTHLLPVGQVGYTPGWAMANVDSVDITIYGVGGHGARPHQAVDPIVAAAHTIVALQTIVSRRVNPTEPAVVTVGSIHAGTKHNIIPDEARLQLTVRSYSDETRRLLLDSIRQITVDTCRAMGCPREPDVVVREEEFTPAGYNDPALTAAAAAIFRRLLGEENVIEMPAEMGGEDFGLYGRHLGVPSVMYRLGTVDPQRYEQSRRPGGPPLPSVHSPFYAPEPLGSLRTGVQTMAALVLALLDRSPSP